MRTRIEKLAAVNRGGRCAKTDRWVMVAGRCRTE